MLHQKGASQEFPPAVGTAGTMGLSSAQAALYIRAPLCQAWFIMGTRSGHGQNLMRPFGSCSGGSHL